MLSEPSTCFQTHEGTNISQPRGALGRPPPVLGLRLRPLIGCVVRVREPMQRREFTFDHPLCVPVRSADGYEPHPSHDLMSQTHNGVVGHSRLQSIRLRSTCLL